MENNIIKWSAMISSWSMSNGTVESPFTHTSLSPSHTLSVYLLPMPGGGPEMNKWSKCLIHTEKVYNVLLYLSKHSSFGSISSAPRN